MVRERDLTFFFYIQFSSLINTGSWRCCLFSNVYFLPPCQNQVAVYAWTWNVNPKCYPIDQYICFSDSTVLFLWLELWSMIWDQAWLYAVSSSIVQEDYFGYPGFLYEIWDFIFNFCEELCWNFNGDYVKTVDCFRQDGHFHNNPMAP